MATAHHTDLIDIETNESMYLYGMELTGKNFFMPTDSLTLGVIYREHGDAERVGLVINNSLPIQRRWQADVTLDAYWENNEDSLFSRSISPKLALNYQQKDNASLGFEIGYLHLIDADSATPDDDIFFIMTQSVFVW